MTLKLYGMPPSTNTVRAVAALTELGLEYEYVLVDMRVGAHKHPDFLAFNPFGQIPVLRDGDITLFDSRAITRYLAQHHHTTTAPNLLPNTTLEAAATLEVWLAVEASQFDPHVSTVVFESLIKPMLLGGTTNTAVVEAAAEKLGKVLDVYETRLGDMKYLAGGEFTLVDLNHMPYINYLMKTPMAKMITSRPNVKAWWELISNRPAWKKKVATIKF